MNEVLRDGLPVEKGVVITREWLDTNEDLATAWLNHWMLYPDLLNLKSSIAAHAMKTFLNAGKS